jgi:hypothetical protein
MFCGTGNPRHCGDQRCVSGDCECARRIARRKCEQQIDALIAVLDLINSKFLKIHLA